ncbi:SGNH/GDSL hydrolase family protein [Bradyrhizobium jicamae]|uniref:SGNH/GDSL hydrolase family protein n=1 Tax=Bradyrhizobium jicamae TaxID=280332 RepID=A0ABS5FIW6_9BRAD|nr:SGNH/GDSL hydrolase family protein [Bradyrhizobium jicamae]MBR0796720.1 SGNH/GDSL hydrolase family protein [Bradyrhizobium jicamae]
MPDPRPCQTHFDIVKFQHCLPHFAKALKRQRKIKVVAFGSSSTAGADGVMPFPPRLEMLLRGEKQFFDRLIDVINRGVGGQEAPEEFSRIEADVVAEAPALVIWQVGTNAVYKDGYVFDEVQATFAAGLDVLAALPLDVVVMDSQFTRAIAAKAELAEKYMAMIADVAADKHVNLFRRFALMKQWIKDGVLLPELDDGGELHTSDWATGCVTQALFEAINDALARTPTT